MKKLLALTLVIVMLIAMAACDTPTPVTPTEPPVETGDQPTDPIDPPVDLPVVKIGSKDFTEQLILGQMTIQVLENAGIKTEDNTNVAGSDTCRTALTAGEFHIYWEYTGTAWSMLLAQQEMEPDPDKLYDKVKAADEANGIIWLGKTLANNTYALVMRQDRSTELGITTYTQLGEYIKANPGKLVLAADHEFTIREDGLPGLVTTYGTDFGSSIKTMDMGIVYQTLGDKQADVGMVFATDGRIIQHGLVVLEDDKNFFPVYNAAPCVRKEIMDAYPNLAELLDPIAAKLTNEVLQTLNAKVDVDGMEPDEVATEWLKAEGFLP